MAPERTGDVTVDGDAEAATDVRQLRRGAAVDSSDAEESDTSGNGTEVWNEPSGIRLRRGGEGPLRS